MSILIQHGTVIDGTGKKGYTADVLIDRIYQGNQIEFGRDAVRRCIGMCGSAGVH